MRLAKTLGLALVALIAVLAVAGVSAASAQFNTVLCKSPELFCEVPVNEGKNVEIHLHAENPTLLTSLSNIVCEESLALLTLLNKLAIAPEKQNAHVLSLSFSGECKFGNTPCTITVTETGGLSILKIGELEASVTGVKLEGRNTLATMKCGSFINCKYSPSEATLLLVQSDSEGHLLLLANETPLAGSGFLCPKEAKWDAVYRATDLKTGKPILNLYIES